MRESHWQGSGDTYTLGWGGRSWVLKFDESGPGLYCQDDRVNCKVLSLCGLAAPGRFADRVFTAATLIGVERYRLRVQATFAPPEWGGLTVRACWSPSCGGAGVDLEVQASATSVGLLHDVEVIVQSRWNRLDGPAGGVANERRVVPRDPHAAALSYDGRESAGDLRSLVTLALTDSPRFQTVTLSGADGGLTYIEMVCPDDVARFMRHDSIAPSVPVTAATTFMYGLFGHDFEKGVVLRARLRGYWIAGQPCALDAGRLYQQFVNEPPPLGP